MTPSHRPYIGLNVDLVNTHKQQGPPRLALAAGYCNAIVAAGGLPLIVPPIAHEVDLRPLLDRLDGFLLTGGGDLDPRRQGLPSHASVLPMAERRESSDRALIEQLLTRRMPLLAVGVGMQQVNVLCGGTLHMHLPADQPRSLPHRDPRESVHRHLVNLESGTRLEEIYGGGELLVVSDHHQAVRTLGRGLRVAARSPDGVIEAFESVDPDWYCVGVQWHPEHESATMLEQQLFESLIQASLRQAKPARRSRSAA
jgi:putative glutamine amidotransferase